MFKKIKTFDNFFLNNFKNNIGINIIPIAYNKSPSG